MDFVSEILDHLKQHPQLRQPSPRDIQVVNNLANDIGKRTLEQLKSSLRRLEHEMASSQNNKHVPLNQLKSGIVSPCPDIIQEIHSQQTVVLNDTDSLIATQEAVVHRITNLFGRKSNIEIEPGPIKTIAKAKAKLAEGRICLDVTRLRLICENLISLIKCIPALENAEELLMRLLYVSNKYVNGTRPHSNGYRAINFLYNHPKNNISPNITTEIRLVTRRMRSTIYFDHPYKVAKLLDLLSPEHGNFLEAIQIMATILDIEETLKQV